jgi:RNA polymerase sigma factor (sigma-70 family)
LIRVRTTPYLIGWARRASWMAPEAEEEALAAMVDRMFEDVWSLTFVSLETQFGAYLRSMPVRVLGNMYRRHVPPGSSGPVDRLDEAVGDDRVPCYAAVEDPSVPDLHARAVESVTLEHAIRQLPSDERHVVLLRRRELENREIARRLGVSPATATRIYQRAVANLRRQLNSTEG